MAELENTELDQALQEDTSLTDRLDAIGRTTVKVAASAVVATSLASALAEPPDASLITLPEPTPIVQVLEEADDDPLPDEDEEQDESESIWHRVFKMLKLLIAALALVGTLAFGVLKGCAGVVGGALFPQDDEQQEQQASSSHAQGEDERGVAY